VQYLCDFWISCAQIRCQLALLAVKYPLSIEVLTEPGARFKAKAMLLFRKLRAKAIVSFVFDDVTFARWPMTIGSLKCEVDVAYGPVQCVQPI
jgi:kinetochore protein Spc7/SPC105